MASKKQETIFWLIFCICLFRVVRCEYKPCQLREYKNGYVCVCNETYCDTTDVKKPTKFGEFVIVSSTKAGQRFNVTNGFFAPHTSPPMVLHVKRSVEGDGTLNDDEKSVYTASLKIDREKQFQKIVGFGGAFTGSVSHLLDLMPASLRRSLYQNYYAQDEGIGYSMMRIPIGGCDFDLEVCILFVFNLKKNFGLSYLTLNVSLAMGIQ